MKNICIIFLFYILIVNIAFADEPERHIYTTQKTGSVPQIDGYFDDSAWDTVPWEDYFIQSTPIEKGEPSQRTEYKVLYDDKNIYMAVRAYDTEPEKLVCRMTRRDNVSGDIVEICFDSHHDLRTAFGFRVACSGVKADFFVSENGQNWDFNWDAVWDAKTSMDDEGWNAEVRIPLSQLRFDSSNGQAWGFLVSRMVYRNNERNESNYIAHSVPGWVSEFGELHGLSGLKSQRQIELMPYAVAKHERFKKEENNPFAKDGNKTDAKVGVDGKVGITSDITLDFTINPDFGQVEADPSQVNLTAFETFFSEKRPFFIEGNNIFDYRVTNTQYGSSSDRLFYSRRIGKAPTRFLWEFDHADMPENSTILGAAKISGKTKNGLSIGILESITAEEKADAELAGKENEEVVEPLTNYFVTRVEKDFRNGNARIGGIFTSVNRKLEEEALEELMHESAYSTGIDGFYRFGDSDYYADANVVFSHVTGDSLAINRTQLSARHYFQRPDANHINYNPSLTSLTGHGGTFKLGNDAGSGWRGQTGITWRSPELELNDMGYMHSADQIRHWTWIGYWNTKGTELCRNYGINFNEQFIWDYDGEPLEREVNINASTSLRNHWYLESGMSYEFDGLSKTTLRGGPALKIPGDLSTNFTINSNSRKKVRVNFGGDFNWGNESSFDAKDFWIWANYRPTNALSITLNPSITFSTDKMQFVTNWVHHNWGEPISPEDSYIFGEIEQKTFRLEFRLDYSITPDLSLQYYGQPFISAGKYSNFKQITNPKADEFTDRFHQFTEDEIIYDEITGMYNVEQNGVSGYGFVNPNFNYKDFQSNLVVRWEYLPGSTLYLVWSQARTGIDPTGKFSFNDDMQDLFKVYPHDVFLVKVSYWFSK